MIEVNAWEGRREVEELIVRNRKGQGERNI